LAAIGAWAVTLEYLSVEDMARQATAIVRGRVVGSTTAAQGPLIYTQYTVEVQERWKGVEAATVQAVVLGGALAGRTQTFAGAPNLVEGSEYVLFLWTGPSGMTQIIGLSQGVFPLAKDASGELLATRAATAEPLLDRKTGRMVNDRPLRLRLSELHSLVRAAGAAK
jgi:hypothetical protein